MNNDELNRLLRSAPPPRRPEGYWERFPGQVLLAIRRQPGRTAVQERSFGGLTVLGLAAVCLTFGLFVQFHPTRPAPGTSATLAHARKYFVEVESLFPGQVQAIVFDRQGPHLLLADKPDVASRTPLFLKLCTKDGCEAVVTFSGQQIPYSGQKCEVLAKADGKVLVVGDRTVWSHEKNPEAITEEILLTTVSL